MAESEFPRTVEDVVATLAGIYRHQGQHEIVELLESASARIEQTDYDNWNGGTYSYGLMLDVPVPVFANVEPDLDKVEQSIASKLTVICRGLGNHHLTSVTITPLTPKSTAIGPRARASDGDVKHIWTEGFLRLFLSHISAHKVAVAKLKVELQLRGISAFVAHEDIAPSLEWQNEIELALRSMHALAALLTPDFHASNWTDQEIGVALGNDILVVPVRLGADPYGFIGKVQGLSGSLDQPDKLATLLANTLLTHPLTHRNMRKGLVTAFSLAGSYSDAIALSKILATVEHFTADEKASIQRACLENDQVFNATGVVSRVCNAAGIQLPSKITTAENEIPF
jgi:hypothetical protein